MPESNGEKQSKDKQTPNRIKQSISRTKSKHVPGSNGAGKAETSKTRTGTINRSHESNRVAVSDSNIDCVAPHLFLVTTWPANAMADKPKYTQEISKLSAASTRTKEQIAGRLLAYWKENLKGGKTNIMSVLMGGLNSLKRIDYGGMARC